MPGQKIVMLSQEEIEYLVSLIASEGEEISDDTGTLQVLYNKLWEVMHLE